MKTNKELIKTYLEQEKTHGQINSLFFEYDRIYSYGYHYILGKFIDDNILIVNDIGYSVTTSQHINLLIWQAQEKGIQVHRITQIETDFVYDKAKYLESKLHKARKPEIWYNAINTLYKKWWGFKKVFGGCTLSNNDIKVNLMSKFGAKSCDTMSIFLRAEKYYTTLTLNLQA